VTGDHESFVLDTSAILALWNEEEGASIVDKLLRTKSHHGDVFVSFMTFMECRYRLSKDHGLSAADEIFRALNLLPVTRIDVDDKILIYASELRAHDNVSVAESWIIATAIARKATLVHKNPEFEAFADRVTLKALPYKKTK
jgi:predicted nucleic acid-binding protein